MERIRAVHLLYGGLGGIGTYFMEFVRSDEHKAFENAAVFYGIEAAHDEYVEFCERQRIEHFTVMKRRGLDLSCYAGIHRILTRRCPDVVFIHSATACPPVFLYAAGGRCHTIFIEHTASVAKSRSDWWASRMAQWFADDVVVFYEKQVDDLVQRFGKAVQKQKITIIPKTVDVRRFSPGRASDGAALAIGMHGRLQPTKDHATLLQAFASIVQKPYGKRLQLRIAGEGATRPALESLASRLGIRECITFTGALNTSELSRFLQGLDVYVQASRGETVCYAIMEAQAAGLPIVASDVEGINNVIRDGESGLLYRLGDAEELAGALDRLLRDPGLRRTYGEKSRSLMVKAASQHNLAQSFCRLLAAPISAS